jgi:hypothetical protein
MCYSAPHLLTLWHAEHIKLACCDEQYNSLHATVRAHFWSAICTGKQPDPLSEKIHVSEISRRDTDDIWTDSFGSAVQIVNML